MTQQPPASLTPAVSNEDLLLASRWNWQAARTLRGLLAAPHDDTQEALTARNQAAIARVAAMMPVNAEEMDLAIHCVAAQNRAAEALLELRFHDGSAEQRAKLHTQYFNAERAANAKRAMLLRVQAARYRREANPKHCWTDEMTMHVATRDLQRAMQEAPPAAAAGTVLPELELAPPLPPEEPAPEAEPKRAGLRLVRAADEPADDASEDAAGAVGGGDREDEEFDDAELDTMHPMDRALLLAMERHERLMEAGAAADPRAAAPAQPGCHQACPGRQGEAGPWPACPQCVPGPARSLPGSPARLAPPPPAAAPVRRPAASAPAMKNLCRGAR